MKQNTAASVEMALMQLVFPINVHQIQEPIGSAPTYPGACTLPHQPIYRPSFRFFEGLLLRLCPIILIAGNVGGIIIEFGVLLQK